MQIVKCIWLLCCCYDAAHSEYIYILRDADLMTTLYELSNIQLHIFVLKMMQNLKSTTGLQSMISLLWPCSSVVTYIKVQLLLSRHRLTNVTFACLWCVISYKLQPHATGGRHVHFSCSGHSDSCSCRWEQRWLQFSFTMTQLLLMDNATHLLGNCRGLQHVVVVVNLKQFAECTKTV